MSLLRLKESIGTQRAFVSGLICLPRYYTTAPELRDAASAAEAGLLEDFEDFSSTRRQPAFTAMDTCKEIFKIIGSQTSLQMLFEETVMDEDAMARFKRMESNVPQTLVTLRESMGTDPFRGLAEAREMGIEVWWALITGNMEAIAEIECFMRKGLTNGSSSRGGGGGGDSPDADEPKASPPGKETTGTTGTKHSSPLSADSEVFPGGRISESFETWRVDINDLDLGARIGSGSQGSCHAGFWGGTKVAVKAEGRIFTPHIYYTPQR